MYYLNLTKGFEPLGEGPAMTFDIFTFNGGEPHIKLTTITEVSKPWTITHRINSFNDLGVLAVAVDALKRTVWPGELYLCLPYFPGARQDRVAVEGEAFTVKIYADMINAMGFDRVRIFDPHSDVTPALLNNCQVVTNHKLVEAAFKNIPVIGTALISPDAGSNKKIYSLAKALPFAVGLEIIKCDKERNVRTGELSGFTVYYDDLKGKPCVIVDDICDGGGTFIGLAEELKKKNAGDLYLIISHGIFSKGFEELKKYFKAIYTTDSIKEYDDLDYEIEQIKLSDL